MNEEKIPSEPNPNQYLWGIQVADVQRLAKDWMGRYCTEEEMGIISRRAFIGFHEWRTIREVFNDVRQKIEEVIAQISEGKKLT